MADKHISVAHDATREMVETAFPTGFTLRLYTYSIQPVASASTYSITCRTAKEYGKKHWILIVQKCI
jgi:hypothetical protein